MHIEQRNNEENGENDTYVFILKMLRQTQVALGWKKNGWTTTMRLTLYSKSFCAFCFYSYRSYSPHIETKYALQEKISCPWCRYTLLSPAMTNIVGYMDFGVASSILSKSSWTWPGYRKIAHWRRNTKSIYENDFLSQRMGYFLTSASRHDFQTSTIHIIFYFISGSKLRWI